MKYAQSLMLSAGLTAMLFGTAMAEPKAAKQVESPAVHWQSNYAKATLVAERENKMLFIYFCDTCEGTPCERFKKETLDDLDVRRKLQSYVCVRLPLAATIPVQGKPVVLLEHDAFREMLGKPGVAIVDYRTTDANRRGAVVSEFPITETLWYTPEQMAVILTLPPGTLTQRTLIYAVRIHPEHPASTEGEMSSLLLEEAQEHSQYQANVRTLGHQFWESRFHRILSLLPGVGAPREVCARSWGYENLVDAAIECVHSWRQSSGHWSAVRSHSRFFGYDMKRGADGIWYATGIIDGQ
jgi:hypothetical protein